MALDPTRVISGNYGFVYDENGNWLANVTAFEASYEITKEDVPRAGTRFVGSKVTTVAGTGSMTMHKVSSEFAKRLAESVKDGASPYITEFNVKLADPENGGVERWRIKGVQFDNVPLVSYEVGSLVSEEYNFTFESAELVEAIE